MSGQVIEFVPLKGFENDYEILNDYPFTIRRKKDKYLITDSFGGQGYIIVWLNGKNYRKHRLIALQFIPNDDPINKEFVDHINHNRTDNHLSNLRWVSTSENQYNKTSNRDVIYDFEDDIPDDAIVVDFYDTKTKQRKIFEEGKYYFDNNECKFYGKMTDNMYRVMHVNTSKTGYDYVNLKDLDNKIINVYIDRFRRQHGF